MHKGKYVSNKAFRYNLCGILILLFFAIACEEEKVPENGFKFQDTLLKEAESEFRKSKYAKSLMLIDSFFQQSKKNERLDEAEGLFLKARCLYWLDEDSEAINTCYEVFSRVHTFDSFDKSDTLDSGEWVEYAYHKMRLESKSEYLLGKIYYFASDYKNAEEYFIKAKEKCIYLDEKCYPNKENLQLHIDKLLVKTYLENEEYGKSKGLADKLCAIAYNKQDTLLMLEQNKIVARSCRRQGEYEEAFYLWNNLLKFSQKYVDIEPLAEAQFNLALVAHDMDSVVFADSLYKEALRNSFVTKDTSLLYSSYRNLGILEEVRDSLKKAVFYYDSAMLYAPFYGSYTQEGEMLLNYSSVLLTQKRTKEALLKMQSIRVPLSDFDIDNRLKAHSNYNEIFKRLKDFEKAHFHSGKMDSLRNEKLFKTRNKNQKLLGVEEEKERLLEYQKETYEKLEDEKAEKTIIFFICCVLVFGLIGIFIALRKKEKKYTEGIEKKMAKHKEQLEKKNKTELLNSLLENQKNEQFYFNSIGKMRKGEILFLEKVKQKDGSYSDAIFVYVKNGKRLRIPRGSIKKLGTELGKPMFLCVTQSIIVNLLEIEYNPTLRPHSIYLPDDREVRISKKVAPNFKEEWEAVQ